MLMKRFPSFELSYETISHKKVCSPQYNVSMAIPIGKKSLLWFTHQYENDVCYMFELNKDRVICNHEKIDTDFDMPLAYGTLLYGSIYHDTLRKIRWFIIEDVLHYQGLNTKNIEIIDKFCLLEKCMKQLPRTLQKNTNVIVSLPVIWKNTCFAEFSQTIPPDIACYIPYPIHHIQYRSATTIMPFINVSINTKPHIQSPQSSSTSLSSSILKNQDTTTSISKNDEIPAFRCDLSKPQYKYPTIFIVSADIQNDIYNLFAYGKNKTLIQYAVAYVPNYKSSIFLNGLFRNIRENLNLDYIEESDDEDDFQDTTLDKYVDLNKKIYMECVFHHKFKKWVPVKEVSANSKVAHINSLVQFQYPKSCY